MTTRAVRVGDFEVLTDSEGYLADPGHWSEGFARAQAELDGLALDVEHWEVIRFLREQYARHWTQMTAREMIRHFRVGWGAERGTRRSEHPRRPARWCDCLREGERRVVPGLPSGQEDTVLVGQCLSVMDIGQAQSGNLVGIVSGDGSSLSHAAILARSLGILAVMGVCDLPLAQLDGHRCIGVRPLG